MMRPPAAVPEISRWCPYCGHEKYATMRAIGLVVVKNRYCGNCGTEYTPAVPLWGAAALMLTGLAISALGMGMMFLGGRHLDVRVLGEVVVAFLMGAGFLGYGWRASRARARCQPPRGVLRIPEFCVALLSEDVPGRRHAAHELARLGAVAAEAEPMLRQALARWQTDAELARDIQLALNKIEAPRKPAQGIDFSGLG